MGELVALALPVGGEPGDDRGRQPGRRPEEPAPVQTGVLLALWLYATLEGVGSARELDRLTRLHHVYRWICGGVHMQSRDGSFK